MRPAFRCFVFVVLLNLSTSAVVHALTPLPSPDASPACPSSGFASCPIPVAVWGSNNNSSIVSQRLYILADNFQIYYREPGPSAKVKRLTSFPLDSAAGKGFPVSFAQIASSPVPTFLISDDSTREWVVTPTSISASRYPLAANSRLYVGGTGGYVKRFARSDTGMTYATASGWIFALASTVPLVDLFTLGNSNNAAKITQGPGPDAQLVAYRVTNGTSHYVTTHYGFLTDFATPVNRSDGGVLPKFIDLSGILPSEIPGSAGANPFVGLALSGNSGQFWLIASGRASPLPIDSATFELPCNFAP